MALNDITNFVQLTDDIGTAGQPTRKQFVEIAAADYDAVINLALASSDHAIADEAAVVTELGMAYVHIPVVFTMPTQDELTLFMGVMRALEGRKVFVHCVMNLRVSAFCYHYLKRGRGLREDEARSPILTKWHPRMTQVWKDFLKLKP